jgi:hypothetical protein
MFDDGKNKLEALKITMDFNRRSNESLNNILFDLKNKYSIEDHDWLQISVAFSLLTTKELLKKR